MAETNIALDTDKYAAFFKRARPFLIVVIVAACIWAIATALHGQSVGSVLAALATAPPASIFIAVLLVALNFGVMSVMERLALEDAGVKLPWRRTALSAFVGNALSIAVGMGPVSGAATRAGLFQAWGVAPQRAAATALSMTLMSLSGGAVLAALGIALEPTPIATALSVSEHALRIAAIAVFAVVMGSLVWAGRRKVHVSLFGVRFSTPTALGGIARLALGATDWLISANIFYVLLARAEGLAPASFATTFAAAHFMGMAAGMPAGLGVFDALMLHIGAHGRAPAEVAAALFLYRLVAYLAPSVIALLVYLGIVRRARAPS
jgi:phosphatidylglycerol lysyltransferase